MSTTGKGLVKEEEENNVEELLLLLPYLTEDIIRKIIIKTPAESLFKSLRYVCKPWYKLINNHPSIPLNRLLCSKPPCLILQTWDHSSHRYVNSGIPETEICEIQNYPTYTTHFIKMGMEGIEEEFDLTPPFKDLSIRGCCNGIMLASSGGRRRNPKVFCVVNPLTNQVVILPPCLQSNFYPKPEFIFLPSTREYKVVLGAYCGETQNYIQILTFSAGVFSSSNVDDHDLNWRLFEAPNRLRSTPLAINGTFYWVQHCHMEEYIVSFDVTAENFCTILHPFHEQVSDCFGGFIEMGGYLAFWYMPSLSLASLLPDNKLDMWILKDSKSGEWTKQYSVTIDPNFIKPQDHYLQLVLSFGNGEVIIFRNNQERTLWAYNVKSNRRWELRNNLTENDSFEFHGFHVDNIIDLQAIFVTE